ncbi:MAG: DUF3369 domain-containing protein [Nitrospinae bacterium]|nr:DUF3369 domain-containing protein [Nitrospinota bacterium]
MNDDDILFADEEDDSINETQKNKPWKIILVDDEKEIHEVTTLALNNFNYHDRELEFFSAYSGSQAKELMKEHPDAAVILLDVVMEHDDSGLEVVKFIREVLKNDMVRIVLRTGQPGKAPERQVFINFDINDYKTKNELTSERLFTSILSSLRSYKDITTIEKSKKGLRQIVEKSQSIFQNQSLEELLQESLNQFVEIVGMSEDKESTDVNCMFFLNSLQGKPELFFGGGSFVNLGKEWKDSLGESALSDLDTLSKSQEHIFTDTYILLKIYVEGKVSGGIYLEVCNNDEHRRDLLELFSQQVTAAIENYLLQESLQQADKLKKYFSPSLCERLTSHDSDEIMHSHQREITVVFLDMRNFTSFVQSTEPHEIMKVLREFHESMGKIIFKYEATLERFTGDGMMIFLGDPIVDIQHADKAIQMVVDMSKEFQRLKGKWDSLEYGLDLGIGISSGQAILGNIGFESRFDYAAIGNVTNLSARLCNSAQGGEVLLCSKFLQLLTIPIDVEKVEGLELKGVSSSQEIYRFIALKE